MLHHFTIKYMNSYYRSHDSEDYVTNIETKGMFCPKGLAPIVPVNAKLTGQTPVNMSLLATKLVVLPGTIAAKNTSVDTE